MITLYHAPRSRSSRFLWLLEELGQPYTIETVSIRRGDGSGERQESYRQIQPHGKVPSIVHDGVTVFESTAIALYLSDAFPEAKLGPRIGEPTRGPYLTWLAYYTGVFEPSFVCKAIGATPPAGMAGWGPTDEVLAHIKPQLERGPYLLGDAMSTADILYGSAFELFSGSPLLPHDPVFTAYVERLVARPAYARARDKDVASAG